MLIKVTAFIVPKLRKSVQEVLDNALKGKGTSNYDLEFTTKSNETRYLLVNATTRRDAEKKIVGVVGVAQDMTETAQHDRGMYIYSLRNDLVIMSILPHLQVDYCISFISSYCLNGPRTAPIDRYG